MLRLASFDHFIYDRFSLIPQMFFFNRAIFSLLFLDIASVIAVFRFYSQSPVCR